jgi:hypothetical protein
MRVVVPVGLVSNDYRYRSVRSRVDRDWGDGWSVFGGRLSAWAIGLTAMTWPGPRGTRGGGLIRWVHVPGRWLGCLGRRGEK